MKWRGRRQSGNINNAGRGGGGRGGLAIGGGGIILALVIFLMTGDPFTALESTRTTAPQTQQEEYVMTQAEKDLYEYSAVVLADTEDAWTEILAKEGIDYKPAQMDIFKDAINTGCGFAQSGTGPFYCSRDNKVYMDLSFFNSLVNDFGAKNGDFIVSYVISHEIGHHVQNVTGIMDQYQKLMQKLPEKERNALTVRLELQADYLAGVVANYQHKKGYLEEGDIDEAISTAWAIGDDTIQKKGQGYVVPESYTHGTSEQRSRWYQKGFKAGDLSEWDTFKLDPSDL